MGSKDEIFLAPSIFLTSPQVNNSLFAEVSTDSFDVVSSQKCDEFPLMNATGYNTSPDLESDRDLYGVMYSKLRKSQCNFQSVSSRDQENNVQNISIHEGKVFSRDLSNNGNNVLEQKNAQCSAHYTHKNANDVNGNQPILRKVNSFDSLDCLLSKMADSVVDSTRQEESLSTRASDGRIMGECSEHDMKINSHGSREMMTMDLDCPHDNFTKGEVNELNVTPVPNPSPETDNSLNECSRFASEEGSQKELLIEFSDLSKSVQKIKTPPSYGSIIKSLEENYYIKSESGYHLPTKALAFLKGEDYSVRYNPYYTFLPEFTPANSKYEQTKNSATLDIKLGRKKVNNLKKAQWIKSCEFHKRYPPDPLRFLSYVKSNNIGGDRRVLSQPQYNPCYTFLPRFDKGALNEKETRSCVEETNEIVQHVTNYKQSGDANSITPREKIEGMKDAFHEGVKVNRVVESKEKKNVSQEEKKVVERENNSVKNEEKDVTKAAESVIKQCFPDLSRPIVTVIPPHAICETSSVNSKHLVTVISHLFRDTMPEPIVHESPSSHSNYDFGDKETDGNITVSHSLNDSNSTQATLSELDPILQDTESSTWKDIGWAKLEKLVEDSKTDVQDKVTNTDDLSEIMCPSMVPFRRKEQPVSNFGTPCKLPPSTLEPPKDFRSRSLTMSSLYEHPHRHNEMSPEIMSKLSANDLLRYQYGGCPLCSSSSTVVDEKELQRLIAKSKPEVDFNSSQTSREFKMKEMSKEISEVRSPLKQTVAGQLLHPQVDAFLATHNLLSRNSVEERSVDAGTSEHTLAPSPRGILTNVRLAAGGSIILSPAIRHGNEAKCMQNERSFSAGHGDGQYARNLKARSRQVQVGKMVRTAGSAPPLTLRGETGEYVEFDSCKTRSSDRTLGTTKCSDKAFPTCKGDEISVQGDNAFMNDREMNDPIKIDEDQMLIFSWKNEEKREKQSNNVFGDRSYTMLHWSDSSYTTTPRHVLAEVLKRVISSVSTYNIKSKSLCSFPSTKSLCDSELEQNNDISFNEEKSHSSQSASLIQNKDNSDRKYNIERQNEVEQTNNEAQDNNKRLSKWNNKFLGHRIPFSNALKKENIFSYPQNIENNDNQTKENINIPNESYSPHFPRKRHFSAEVTSSELNMYINYPIIRQPGVYSWWSQHQRFSKKNTGQKLLETSSTYTIYSSEEECDIISWRD